MQNTTRNAAQREGARPSPQNDAQKIAEHMARLSIAGLPRNYELLHEAVCGRNTALATVHMEQHFMQPWSSGADGPGSVVPCWACMA